MRGVIIPVVCASAIASATTAKTAMGAVILDHSPAATGASEAGEWRNVAFAQNLAERILFATEVEITGMDIYSLGSTRPEFGPGFEVTVRLWEDDGGALGTLVVERVELISVVDSLEVGSISNISRYHADFSSPLTIAGNTRYWIGMSGTTVEFGMTGLGGPNAPDDGKVYQLNGTTPGFLAEVGDMAFRLQGTAVPEPTALTTFGLGMLIAAAGSFLSSAAGWLSFAQRFGDPNSRGISCKSSPAALVNCS